VPQGAGLFAASTSGRSFPLSLNLLFLFSCKIMKDDKGKVILSLLAGATAGIVAGLLLAPETGDDTRSQLKRSATKWGGDLSKLFKDTLAKAQGGAAAGHTNTEAIVPEDKQAADRLLSSIGANAHALGDPDTDYDGFGDTARHQPLL
jgi:gas vesicle protein